MKTSLLTFLILTAFVSLAAAQPLVSIYTTLDKSPVGPAESVPFGSVQTLYVVVENADMMVAGAAFRIDDTTAFSRLSVMYPVGTVTGDLVSGVQLGFAAPMPQFETPAVVASMEIYVDRLGDVTYGVEAYPGAGSILVQDDQGAFHVADGNTLTLMSFINPEIGVFFDEQGTQQAGTFNGGVGETAQAYLMLRELDHSVDSVYLSLDLPAGMSLLGAELADGLAMSGDLNTGAIISSTSGIPAGGTAMLATLTLSTGSTAGASLPLTVAGHMDYGAEPYVVVVPVGAYVLEALESFMYVPVATEARSWSGVKALYR